MSLLVHGARKLDADGIVEDFWFAAEGDRIRATGTGASWREQATDDVTDAAGAWLTPGFIDLHHHGAGGFAYEGGDDAIRAALATHRAHGTTRSALSLVANPVEALGASLERIAGLAADDPLILGSHLEGPFLAESHKGAHNPAFLLAPTAEVIDALLDAARGTLRQVTLAPELPGGLDAIERFAAAGVVAAVGHTAATYETARAAFDAGATVLTHAFNAMEGIHHRAPGPVIAALEDDRVTLELVLDGVHVHPSVAAMIVREAPARIALVTDAMAAAGAGDGDYVLGSLAVTVRDGVARITETGSIAGSTLLTDAALGIAIQRAGFDPVAAVSALTLTPARVLGRDDELGLLAAGYAADAVLLDASFTAQRVWANGIRLR
ncbi:amidohydrolase family protein [Rathayibacter sp. YIM 133350]|uniref:N-acetylglucosamine-6-phosphate deacetylase n=1 Tax=Rathayibacter sp. YIM 133350 TaxID=3131992 RepID=UPI00307F72E7